MHEPIELIFEFAGEPSLRFTAPRAIVRAMAAAEVRQALERVDELTRGGAWAAGYVAYEAAAGLDPAMRTPPPAALPLVWFGIFDAPSTPIGEEREDVAGDDPTDDEPVPSTSWHASTTRSSYDRDIADIRESIARGDVYQVNHTVRLHTHAAAEAETLWRRLTSARAGAYAARLRLGGGWTVLSASPELFFRRRGDTVETRPMKGTRERGRWTAEDDALAEELRSSPKDRAENLMIVDLLRNDLGKVARTGTVHVPRLFDLERYATVWQMTSTIAAEVPTERTLAELFAALFPCGSVTGAPKIAAMQQIARLEPEPRGVYCGAIGFVRPGGDCVFNVAIRTATIDPAGDASYGVGGGITWDSSAEAEYAEALSKAIILARSWPEFRLLETMRAENGSIPRLDRHLSRLGDSARYFGFSFDESTVMEALTTRMRSVAAPERIRLLVDRHGAVELQSAPLEALPPPPLQAGVTDRPISSSDRFLYHKTTHRSMYETRARLRPDCVDVLLHNERGLATEFTRGNLVIEIEGSRLTPPLDSGLLAGTFRAELLESGEIEEADVDLGALGRASRIWLINSVREWVPVRLTTEASGG